MKRTEHATRRRAKARSRLYRVRRANDHTLQSLAAAAGLTAHQVWRIENGLQTPDWPQAARLAAALNTTPDDLWPVQEQVA